MLLHLLLWLRSIMRGSRSYPISSMPLFSSQLTQLQVHKFVSQFISSWFFFFFGFLTQHTLHISCLSLKFFFFFFISPTHPSFSSLKIIIIIKNLLPWWDHWPIDGFDLMSWIQLYNLDLDGGSRVLYGLAKDHMAPKLFRKCTKEGLPLPATVLSVIPGLLAYMNLDQQSSTLFNWLVNLSATSGLLTWWTVCLVSTSISSYPHCYFWISS